MRTSITLLVWLWATLAMVAADSTLVEREPVMNIGAESYAVAFRDVGGHGELWVTIATSRRDVERRSLAMAAGSKQGYTQPTEITDASLNAADGTYNGVPNFNPCDPNEMIFVSDRATSATARRSNDLYMARQTTQGWSADRLSISSGAWDDTPTFGPRGAFIYFSSDRHAAGSGQADIFISRRTASGWTEPVPVNGLDHTGRNETSPFVFNNTLYFSTNASGDQDIWMAPIDPETGMLTAEPQPCGIAGVNMKGSNEYHPTFSPGGRWLYFSSDRDATSSHAFKIYRMQLPITEQRITLHVTARTVIRDAEKRKYFGDLDSISSVKTTVNVTDMNTGRTSTLTTAADGTVDILTTDASSTAAHATDMRTRTFIVQATPHAPSFVSSIDTIIVGTGPSCAAHLEHVVYLDDTTTRKRRCEFTFRTFNVPFYVTAYWCPTTRKYRQYTGCTSLFTDDLACAELAQPEHCTTNEAFTFQFTPAVLTRTSRSAENCVAYKEFNDSGMVWAEQVDANIEHMRDEVRSALTDACVQQAVARGMMVELRYVGTTDDRAIHPHCQYTGKAYDELHALAPDIEIDTAIIPFIAPGTHFNHGGYGGKAGGNQLLSDLRALNFAILFDNLCSATVEGYAALRRSGQLHVRASGQAIDSRDLPYSYKRAAGVEIRVPGFEEKFAGRPVLGGRRVVLCPESECAASAHR